MTDQSHINSLLDKLIDINKTIDMLNSDSFTYTGSKYIMLKLKAMKFKVLTELDMANPNTIRYESTT